MLELLDRIRKLELIAREGRVTHVRGQFIEAEGPETSIGEICHIEHGRHSETIRAEVVGFRSGKVLLMPYGSTEGIRMGTPVLASGDSFSVPVGPGLIGRIVDAFGAPLDGKGPIACKARRQAKAAPPDAMKRSRINEPLETGVKAIDTLLTMAKGQRIGLFAGSGVGKSTLLGMLAQSSAADINVIALIGERGREVREFVEDQLGPEGLKQAVVVVATADLPALIRVKAAYTATSIAEYFRDRGGDVLLTMDSLTRFAMAQREIGLAVGEPPTSRGYTPSVFSELAELCERGGMGERTGSISAIYTVLVEGDDLNEPISDAVRATLDGHVVLSRDLANAGQYPAIDVLKSISRLASAVMTSEKQEIVRKAVGILALFERNRQLIEVGAYKSGVSQELDTAVQLVPRINEWLSQKMGTHVQSLAAQHEIESILSMEKKIDSGASMQ